MSHVEKGSTEENAYTFNQTANVKEMHKNINIFVVLIDFHASNFCVI